MFFSVSLTERQRQSKKETPFPGGCWKGKVTPTL